MTDKEKKFLFDIIESIKLIESFTRNTSSFEEYTKDLKTKSAVERQLGIIGEAVNKLSQDSFDLTKATRIISLRNRIIHAYDNIDDSIIWVILKRHLSPLKEEVSKLIN